MHGLWRANSEFSVTSPRKIPAVRIICGAQPNMREYRWTNLLGGHASPRWRPAPPNSFPQTIPDHPDHRSCNPRSLIGLAQEWRSFSPRNTDRNQSGIGDRNQPGMLIAFSRNPHRLRFSAPTARTALDGRLRLPGTSWCIVISSIFFLSYECHRLKFASTLILRAVPRPFESRCTYSR